MKRTLQALSFICLLPLATRATAQVIFTVTANATASVQGYTSGISYTFIFTATSGADFSSTSNSTFDGGAHEYSEELTTDPQLWSSVSGSGVLGTFVRPTGNINDPNSNVGAFGSGPQSFQIRAGTNRVTTTNIGLTTLSGGQLSRVQADLDDGTLPTFTYPGSYSSLEAYYPTYVGTYGGFTAGDDIVRLYDTSNVLYLSFDITSVQISAIPEPTVFVALAGAASLGLALMRRRILRA